MARSVMLLYGTSIQSSTELLTPLYSSSRFHDQPVSKTLMVTFHVIVRHKPTSGIPQ